MIRVPLLTLTLAACAALRPLRAPQPQKSTVLGRRDLGAAVAALATLAPAAALAEPRDQWIAAQKEIDSILADWPIKGGGDGIRGDAPAARPSATFDIEKTCRKLIPAAAPVRVRGGARGFASARARTAWLAVELRRGQAPRRTAALHRGPGRAAWPERTGKMNAALDNTNKIGGAAPRTRARRGRRRRPRARAPKAAVAAPASRRTFTLSATVWNCVATKTPPVRDDRRLLGAVVPRTGTSTCATARRCPDRPTAPPPRPRRGRPL